MMIDIKQSPVLCTHTNKAEYHLNILANLQPNSLLCRPTFDVLCTVIEAHKDAMTKLSTLL